MYIIIIIKSIKSTQITLSNMHYEVSAINSDSALELSPALYNIAIIIQIAPGHLHYKVGAVNSFSALSKCIVRSVQTIYVHYEVSAL